jgi:3-phenylpropionate/trans-cinnamate dioxygenase ferredoxin subunit
MGTYVKAGKTGEFQKVAKKKVNVQGHDVLLARVDDKYYAIASRCPHLGGDLAAGNLEGTIITCPLHGSQFDVTDGHNVRWLKGTGPAAAVGKVFRPPRSVRSYNVKVEGDSILVEV